MDDKTIEAVTKAILFEDCGDTRDWRDNVDLGQAAVEAMLETEQIKAWRGMADEYDQLIRHMSDGGDFHEFQRDRAAKEQQV